jgi:hypothetical protein
MQAKTVRLKVWGLRLLFVAGLVVLCAWADSGFPALAFALAWGPNGLFLVAFTRGALRLPRVLVRVRPVEPVLYRWLGVGLVKQVVANHLWPLANGFEPPPRPRGRQELLHRTEQSTMGAEVCHATTFLLVCVVSLFWPAVGTVSEATWIVSFNVLLNAYPVMLQRANRWRVQQVRLRTDEARPLMAQ